MLEWRNWQTHGTQNPAPFTGMRVRPPPPAPPMNQTSWAAPNLLTRRSDPSRPHPAFMALCCSSRRLKKPREPRCERRHGGCAKRGRRRCDSSGSRLDKADALAPPQPFGRQGFAALRFVTPRSQWTRIAHSSRLAQDYSSLPRGRVRLFQQPVRCFWRTGLRRWRHCKRIRPLLTSG